MRRAILTGATGALGTALIKELVGNGIEVLVLCHRESRRNENIPPHPLVELKMCNLDELEALRNDTGKMYDVFYHLAWMGTSGVGRNDMYLQNKNIKYALDAVKIAHRFGCQTFIGAGSQAEYGRTTDKLSPDTATFPDMGYGYAKLCAGQMTRDYAHQLGMRHIWTRVLSVYGPNDGAQSMVMSTINKLRLNEIPQFTKAEQIWDYLYSGDAARAFYLLGEKGRDGMTYVLGSGKPRMLAEYIKDIRDMVNPSCALGIGAIPYGENPVMYLCADVSALEEDCGWSAEVDFRDGIKKIMVDT